jgi:hypothetical protein
MEKRDTNLACGNFSEFAMFEHFSDPLPPRVIFLWRFARNFLGGVAIILGSLLCGMLGYRYFEAMTWTDSYLNATMILSGMGPIGTPQTESGKVFAGTYALYSGFVVIVASGIVFAPVLHRMLHRFHLSDEHQKKSPRRNSTRQETIP